MSTNLAVEEVRASSRTKLRDHIFRLALRCTAVYCVAGAVLLIIAAARYLPGHRENEYTETPTVYAAVHAIRTGRLYYSFTAPPYSPQPYGPLFYSYNAALALVAHGDILRTLLLARVAAFVCFLLCALVIERICRRLGFGAWHAQLAALLFLALPVFYRWNAADRPDFACLLLMLLSLLYAMQCEGASALAYVPSSVFAGAAFLIKQPGVAAAISTGAVLLLSKRYRQAIVFGLAAAAPVVAAALVLLWRQEEFWPHLLSIARTVFSLQNGSAYTRQMLSDPNNLVPLVIACIGLPEAVRSGGRSRMLLSFLVVNLGFGLATILELGGNYNYFFPMFAGCVMLLPFAMRAVANSRKAVQMLVCVATILGLPLALAANVDSHWKAALRGRWRQPALPVETLRNLRILADEPYFALLGRDPEFLDRICCTRWSWRVTGMRARSSKTCATPILTS